MPTRTSRPGVQNSVARSGYRFEVKDDGTYRLVRDLFNVSAKIRRWCIA